MYATSYPGQSRYAGYTPEFVRRVHQKQAEARRLSQKQTAARGRPTGDENLAAERSRRSVAKATALSEAHKLRVKRDQDIERQASRPVITAKDAAVVYAAERGYLWHEIIAPNQSRAVVEVRHGAMLRVRALFPALSYPQIGRIFQRDHTTVLSAVRKAHKMSEAV